MSKELQLIAKMNLAVAELHIHAARINASAAGGHDVSYEWSRHIESSTMDFHRSNQELDALLEKQDTPNDK